MRYMYRSQNIHRSKRIVRIVLFQFIMISLFTFVIIEARPIDASKVVFKRVSVDEVLLLPTLTETELIVRSGSEKYIFSNSVFRKSEYSKKELYEILLPVDNLDIVYGEDNELLGKRKLILAASTDDVVFYTLADYYASFRGVSLVVVCVFVLFEVFFAFVVYVDCKLNMGSKHRKRF